MKMLSDSDVLGLERVKVKDNQRLTHLCFDIGTYGVGNTNVSAYDGKKTFYDVKSFEGERIEERQGGIKIVAIVQDVLYLVVNGVVKRLTENEWFGGSSEIAYDTRESFSISPVRLEKTTVNLSDGRVYEGNVLNGKFEGWGTITYPKKNGGGIKTLRAIFSNGVINRNCTIEFVNGDRYVGETVGEVPEGEGVYTFSNGEKLKGSFYGGINNGGINGRGFLYAKGGKMLGYYSCVNGEIVNRKDN